MTHQDRLEHALRVLFAREGLSARFEAIMRGGEDEHIRTPESVGD